MPGRERGQLHLALAVNRESFNISNSAARFLPPHLDDRQSEMSHSLTR